MSDRLMPRFQNLSFPDPYRLGGDQLQAMSDLHLANFERGWSVDVFEHFISDQNSFGLVALRSAKLIGYSLVLPAIDTCELIMIVTDTAHRNSGVGSFLLQQTEALAKMKGFERMLLEVAIDNQPALQIYQKQGFSEDGLRKKYYKRLGQPAVDAILMSKPIK